MKKKQNYSYVGIAFIILIFGIFLIPKIVDRVSNNDIVRKKDRDYSHHHIASDLSYISIDGKNKRVPNFLLTDQNGKIITNKNYEGMVYVIEFFFTTCHSICPLMNTNLVSVQNTFEGIGNFGIASFTINPDYDTPQVLKAYAQRYGVTNSNWHFMTGRSETIYSLASKLNVTAQEDHTVPDGFIHSGNFILVDKKGFIRSRKDTFGNPIIYYRGAIPEVKKVDRTGDTEQISILKEDIKKLLQE